MRVLMTSLPVEAHFHTVVPTGWALEAAGHDVQVASKPALTDLVTTSGLTAVPVGSGAEHTELLGRIGADLMGLYANVDFTGTIDEPVEKILSDNDVLTGTFYALNNDEDFVRGLIEYARFWKPDLIIWEQFTFAGAIAAAALDIPHCRLVWSPDLFYQMRQKLMSALDDRPLSQRDDALRDWLESAVRKYGRPFSDDLFFGQRQLELTPPETRVPSSRVSISARYVTYNGVSVIPDWLREPPKLPRVVLTMGITSGPYGIPIDIESVLKKLGDLDVEVIAIVCDGEQHSIAPIPGRLRLVEFVPITALLPSCDAIIHHGGTGSWASAIAAGIPQLIVSNLWDNAYRGKQIAELGAGIFLPPDEADPETIRDTVAMLLAEDKFRAGALRLRESVRSQPSLADIVSRLEELAASA